MNMFCIHRSAQNQTRIGKNTLERDINKHGFKQDLTRWWWLSLDRIKAKTDDIGDVNRMTEVHKIEGLTLQC